MSLNSLPSPFFPKQWRRVNRSHPCPICQHKDYCNVTEDDTLVHCMRAGRYPVPPGWVFVKFDKNGDGQIFRNEFSTPTSFPSLNSPAAAPTSSRANKISLEPATNLVELKTATPGSAATEQDEDPGSLHSVATRAQPGSEEERARVIEWLLAKLELCHEHQQFLEGEGITLERARERGYRTLPGPYQERKQILAELEDTFRIELLRGMGFCYERQAKRGGRYLCFAGVKEGVAALLFPIRNSQGKPIALKARWQESATGERVYRLMSAGSTELGATVGTPVHVAQPLKLDPALSHHLVITEGERKADSVADRLGVKVLGVQGSGNWRAGKLLHLISTLKPTIETIVLAYDQDEKPEVRQRVERHSYEMGEQLAGAGYRVLVAEWDGATGKGLDDFLRKAVVTGQRWKLRHFGPRSAASSSLSPPKAKST